MYDAVIVGASFAGLAVANALRGRRVLLVDRKPVGEEQTSACATPLRTATYWGVEDAVRQRHDALVLHVRHRSVRFDSPYPWCTFDYRCLCEILFRRSGAEFLRATALGVVGDRVRTDRGDIEARCIVDASGWRGALSRPRGPIGRRRLNFGLNAICAPPTLPDGGREALHFWYDAAILPAAMAWVFPRGETATIGLGSYRGVRPMRAAMERFARSLGVKGYGLHGAYFPCALARPTAGRVFVVGDAAGQCIALTGEGVRPALYFGEACGRVLEHVLAGATDLKAALAQYAAIVAGKERFYRFFTRMQWVLTRVPVPLVEALSVYTAADGQRPRVLERYWSLTREWGPPA